jgi:hypothetical protein
MARLKGWEKPAMHKEKAKETLLRRAALIFPNIF